MLEQLRARPYIRLTPIKFQITLNHLWVNMNAYWPFWPPTYDQQENQYVFSGPSRPQRNGRHHTTRWPHTLTNLYMLEHSEQHQWLILLAPTHRWVATTTQAVVGYRTHCGIIPISIKGIRRLGRNMEPILAITRCAWVCQLHNPSFTSLFTDKFTNAATLLDDGGNRLRAHNISPVHDCLNNWGDGSPSSAVTTAIVSYSLATSSTLASTYQGM